MDLKQKKQLLYTAGDLVELLKHPKKVHNGPLAVVQGCNCFMRQGRGLAAELRAFPQIYQTDVKYGKEGEFNGKIGDLSLCNVNGVLVVNGYIQYTTYGDRPANYAAIGTLFLKINKMAYGTGTTVYIPRIGAGLAKGDWNIIEKIIADATPDTKVIVVDYVNGKLPEYI